MDITGVVQVNPPDRGFNADDLERMRVGHVRTDMLRGDQELRRKHVEALKTEKLLAAGKPSIKSYWASVVGERNAADAFAVLNMEADAEIAQDAAAAALAAAKKR